NARSVTLRMLLSHQTGIYDVISDSDFYLSVLNNPNRNWSQEDLIKFIRGDEAAFEAGSTSGYSNSNYLIVSMAIEGATGRSHAELLREKILAPLQLHD